MGQGTSKSFGYVDSDAEHIGRGRPGMRELVRELDGSFSKLETPGQGGTGTIAVGDWDVPLATDDDYVLGATAAISTLKTVTTFLHATLDYARNLIVTCTVTGTGAGSVFVYGTDIDGNALSEEAPVPASTGVVTLTKGFKTITYVTVPPTTTGMTVLSIKVGIGVSLALPALMKYRHTHAMCIAEIMDGAAAVTPGTFATATNAAPYGSYTPNAAPNHTHEYILFFERDNG